MCPLNVIMTLILDPPALMTTHQSTPKNSLSKTVCGMCTTYDSGISQANSQAFKHSDPPKTLLAAILSWLVAL